MNHLLYKKLYPSLKGFSVKPFRFSSTHAANVFNTAEFIAATSCASSIPQPTQLPEIIVTGRANVGKSTILNAVLGQKDLLRTSKKAGHTKTLNFYRVGQEPGRLIMVDAPGYGARGRPEWGALFDHYIQSREQLKRVYILFNAKHGLNDHDSQMLAHLSSLLLDEKGHQRFTMQAVITKADTMPSLDGQVSLERIRKNILDAAPLCLLPILTSAQMKPPFGIDKLQRNILSACNLC